MSSLALPRSLAPRSTTSAPARTAAPTVRWLWHQRSIVALFGLLTCTASVVIAVLVASLIGPFIMFAIPFLLLLGFALGPLHAMLRGDL
jgi:hypothetical protein